MKLIHIQRKPLTNFKRLRAIKVTEFDEIDTINTFSVTDCQRSKVSEGLILHTLNVKSKARNKTPICVCGKGSFQ